MPGGSINWGCLCFHLICLKNAWLSFFQHNINFELESASIKEASILLNKF